MNRRRGVDVQPHYTPPLCLAAPAAEGILRAHHDGGEELEGFRWRISTDLQVNNFWLDHYVTENAARQNGVKEPRKANRVWFDDIVVVTEYIGPIAK